MTSFQITFSDIYIYIKIFIAPISASQGLFYATHPYRLIGGNLKPIGTGAVQIHVTTYLSVKFIRISYIQIRCVYQANLES